MEDAMPITPHFTPQSLEWASDTQNLQANASPEHLLIDPYQGLSNQEIFVDDLFTSYQEHDLDWIFQTVNASDDIDFQSTIVDRSVGEGLGPAPSVENFSCNAQEPASVYQDNNPNKDSWLLDSTLLPERPLDIPGLGGDPGNRYYLGSHYQLDRVTDAGSKKIQQSIKVSLERPIWNTVTMKHFPSKEKLDHCIDLFFVNWRPVRALTN